MSANRMTQCYKDTRPNYTARVTIWCRANCLLYIPSIGTEFGHVIERIGGMVHLINKKLENKNKTFLDNVYYYYYHHHTNI